MPPFADAVAMVDAAFREHLTDPAFWRPGGVPAGPDPVGVILLEPTVVMQLGLGRAEASSAMLQVFKVDVAAPARGDLVQMQLTGRAFKIIADPRLDDEGTLWSCEAAEIFG